MVMTEKDFSLRLAKLREEKGVSARDMSLSMGQNPGYINNIESGKSPRTSLTRMPPIPRKQMSYIALQEA